MSSADSIEGYHASKDPAQDNVDEDTGSDADTRDFEDGNRVALLCHPCQSAGAAFQVRRERGKDFALQGNTLSVTVPGHIHRRPDSNQVGNSLTYRMVDGFLILRIVVDVDRY